MTNRKTTRRALVLSILSLLVCCSMLVGTTFAWFTDSVTSGNNRIVAGNLDVELYNSVGIVEGKEVSTATPLFNEVTLWEPGVVAYENLTVANVGTLALKYQLAVNFTGENSLNGNKLSDILQVGLVEGGIADGTTREAAVAAVEGNWQEMKSFAWEGELAANTTDTPVALVIWWEPGDEDNGWNANNGKETSDGKALHIDLGINLAATQMMAESDSFDNTYDEPAPLDVVIYENGGVVNMTENETAMVEVAEGAAVVINMNGNTIENGVVNRGDLELNGGTIEVDAAGFQNEGTAELTDVTMNAGTSASYSNITKAGGETVYNNVTLNSAGGGVGAAGGAQVVFNSGSVEVDCKNTSGRYIFYAEGEGTVITVNGGNFSFDTNLTLKRAYVYASAGTTVYINGGNFGKPSTRSNYNAGIMGPGTVIITGGTFGFDPTNWVADGYQAVKDGTTWTVSAVQP